jgi:hypothetical protein
LIEAGHYKLLHELQVFFLLIGRAGQNFLCPLISPLSVDPLINGTALIFQFENVNLMEERIFLNLFMAPALIFF